LIKYFLDSNFTGKNVRTLELYVDLTLVVCLSLIQTGEPLVFRSKSWFKIITQLYC